MKTATITINKSYVLYDVNSLTYKRVDGVMSDQSDRLKNAISSDSEEELDRIMLYRYMDDKDANLKRKLAFCLVKDEGKELAASNAPSTDKPAYEYKLNVPDTWDADMVAALSARIHQYIVDGTAYDWYSRQGLEFSVSASELEDRLTKLAASLRKPFVNRPLQPFGPAN